VPHEFYLRSYVQITCDFSFYLSPAALTVALLSSYQRRFVMRYDADHKEHTRARILTAAARSMLADGPSHIGVADVMRKVGLTHGGFYAHFASKDDLIIAAIELIFDEALTNFQRLTRGKAPADAVAAYIDWYLSPRHRDARETGCPMPALSADLRRLGSAARGRFSRGADRLVRSLAMLLSATGHAGTESLAASAFAEMIGALLLARSIPLQQSGAVLEGSRTQLQARLGIAKSSRPRRDS
jgi:TetR/AcrR family transcriptional regulator, transcriptional repressor for nem operon